MPRSSSRSPPVSSRRARRGCAARSRSRRRPMQVEWYGQSAFALRAPEATVFVDPFGDVSAFGHRGMRFEYAPIAGVVADLVLVTHEHFDHNAPEVIGGDPQVVRSTAGRFDTPIGPVVA